MGLINIEHRKALNSMTDIMQDMLKNPYYLFNDQKATVVDFFNIDIERSTLDEAAMIPYANLGPNSPLRFCVIYDMYVFGIDRIMLSLENGEYGLESGEITGEAFVLPNTIQPYAGSYFRIKYVDKTYLFRVNSVNSDTLQDGANIWRFEYKLDQLEDKLLLPLITQEYVFNVNNNGTKYHSVIKKGKYDVAFQLDQMSVTLKEFYKSMFYNEKVQTFTVLHLDIDPEGCAGQVQKYFYDPYLIEFLIRNKVMMANGDKYLHITHQTPKSRDFTINYIKSIWKILEDRDLDNFKVCTKTSEVDYIDNPMTIFQSRYEDYFQLTYRNLDKKKIIAIVLRDDITEHILSGELYEEEEYKKYNILIKYFHEETFTVEDIVPYDKLQYLDAFDEEYYFLLPMVIYCIDNCIKNLIS